MVSLQVLNATLNICLWLINAIFAKILERIYISTSKLQFRRTGKTFALDSGEVSIYRGFKSFLNMLSCYKLNRNHRYISTTWVAFLILLSFFSLPSEVWVETGIDERNNCAPELKNSTGLCATPWWYSQPVSGIATAALLVQNAEWIDSDWNIIYEGSRVNISTSEVHRKEIGQSFDAETKTIARDCNVRVLPCTECGTLRISKKSNDYNLIVSNASIVDESKHCLGTNGENYCRGDFTYDGATSTAFFFWPVRTTDDEPERRIATKGIEVILNDQELGRALSILLSNGTDFDISPSAERSRLYSISCFSDPLHWTDLTRTVAIYRGVQMESPGAKKENVNVNINNLPPLTNSDALKSLFSLKAGDMSSYCPGLVPHYSQCGALDISRASMLLAVFSIAVLLLIALRIAELKQEDVVFPVNVSSWKKYATGARTRGGDFVIEIDSESPGTRLMAVDVKNQMCETQE